MTLTPPRTCAGCGAELPTYPVSNRPRKWCSGKCRKASYGDPCIDCGQRTVYGAETARVPAPRCDGCNKRHESDRRCERVMAMLRLRRDGLTNIEVGRELGCPTATVSAELHRLRSLGFDMPNVYRANFYADDRKVTLEAQVLGRELAKRGITPALEGER